MNNLLGFLKKKAKKVLESIAEDTHLLYNRIHKAEIKLFQNWTPDSFSHLVSDIFWDASYERARTLVYFPGWLWLILHSFHLLAFFSLRIFLLSSRLLLLTGFRGSQISKVSSSCTLASFTFLVLSSKRSTCDILFKQANKISKPIIWTG